jgi:hypothetical protein
MRDIRNDLQERADWLDEQINSSLAQFEKYVEQLKLEHDNRVKDLKVELEAVNALLGIELRRHGNVQAPSAPQAAAQPRPRPQQPLADFIIRRLSEGGPMSKEAIQHLTVQEGYFADSDAERGVQAVLLHVVKAGHIRQLPNGDFAEVIRLRRAI